MADNERADGSRLCLFFGGPLEGTARWEIDPPFRWIVERPIHTIADVRTAETEYRRNVWIMIGQDGDPIPEFSTFVYTVRDFEDRPDPTAEQVIGRAIEHGALPLSRLYWDGTFPIHRREKTG